MKIERKNKFELDLYSKLKWLTFFRALFAAVLLCSALVVGFHQDISILSDPLILLYAISFILLILSTIYGVRLAHTRHLVRMAYFQLIIDTLLVSCIIFVTGSFSSVFSFLYLVVIIYASMVIYRRGGMIIAVLCAIQYGLMIDLEYFGLIRPLGFASDYLIHSYKWDYVLYKIVIIMTACLATAFLSGFLAEQERRAKQELWSIEEQIKRVEKLAAIGEMASGLAHEIKNPLASLSGSIQMLREDLPYEPDRDRLMEIILRETNRISSLLTEFLMFAKPRPGKKKLIDLRQALDETIKYFESDNRRNRKIKVVKELSEDIRVEIDPDHLRQIVWNLLLNAEEAIEDEGTIRIRLYANKKYACVAISDDGCGMTEETMESIFDPFFTRKAKGTGLGLSIVQRIITSYNGLIEVESTQGAGSTFTLRFFRSHPPRQTAA